MAHRPVSMALVLRLLPPCCLIWVLLRLRVEAVKPMLIWMSIAVP
jgi:hypothetical protein